jgi:threonine aldolase
VVDLRSDTVTRPTAAMRAAMAAAAVGDDVYGDDPTVLQLERVAAALLPVAAGPAATAALFVPSGTMANLLALGTHCGRGDEVLCGDHSHIYNYEAGGASVLMGVPLHPLPNLADGTLDLAAVAAAVRPDDPHCARSRVLALEQTHNLAGGQVLPLAYLQQARATAAAHGLALHVDGARFFNAACALGVPAAALSATCDTLSVCLSKGLGAPVGSLLLGPAPFIHRARRLRKMVGGGLRQSGVLAAAALVALEQHVPRLGEDHALARYLAAGLAALPGVALSSSTAPPASNVVYFTPRHVAPAALAAALARRGVLLSSGRAGELRALTHLDVDRAAVDRALALLAELTAPGARLDL